MALNVWRLWHSRSSFEIADHKAFGQAIRILSLDVLANFCCDLPIRHLVGRFNRDGVSPTLGVVETLLEFTLGFAGTKDQNGFGIANCRNHLGVILIEMARKLTFTGIIGLNLLWFVGNRRTDTLKTARLFFNVGFDLHRLFPFVRDNRDDCLSMINPQTCGRIHIVFLVRLPDGTPHLLCAIILTAVMGLDIDSNLSMSILALSASIAGNGGLVGLLLMANEHAPKLNGYYGV